MGWGAELGVTKRQASAQDIDILYSLGLSYLGNTGSGTGTARQQLPNERRKGRPNHPLTLQ